MDKEYQLATGTLSGSGEHKPIRVKLLPVLPRITVAVEILEGEHQGKVLRAVELTAIEEIKADLPGESYNVYTGGYHPDGKRLDGSDPGEEKE